MDRDGAVRDLIEVRVPLKVEKGNCLVAGWSWQREIIPTRFKEN